MSKTLSQELGQWGEEVAYKYLKNKGYTILDRNFRKKWGEIDIICTINIKKIGESLNIVPRGTIWSKIKRFFAENKKVRIKNNNNVPHGTINRNNPSPLLGTGKIVFIEVKTTQSKLLRPEENVTPAKQKILIRSCQLYLSSNNYSLDTDWQIDVIGILLDRKTGKAKVEHIERAVYFD